MANASSTVIAGQKITAAGHNNLRSDAIGPYGDKRVFPDSTALKFGTGEDVSIQYDGTDLIIRPRDVGTGNVLIDDAAILMVNESSNASMTVGLTINQGANTDEILALKSSDINHALSGVAEADTFMAVRKNSATLGGARLISIAEDDAIVTPMLFNSYGGTADTTKTTSGSGLVGFTIYEHNGAGSVANITADGNVFAIKAFVGGGASTRFLVDEDGDIYSVTAAQTFDDYDDLALVDSYDRVRSGYLDWTKENEAQLIELGILGAPVAEGGLTNMTQLCRLLTGAVRQLGDRLQVAEARLNALPASVADPLKEG